MLSTKSFLDKTSNPADIAVFFITYAIVFGIVIVFEIDLSATKFNYFKPEIVAGIFATGILGVKQLFLHSKHQTNKRMEETKDCFDLNELVVPADAITAYKLLLNKGLLSNNEADVLRHKLLIGNIDNIEIVEKKEEAQTDTEEQSLPVRVRPRSRVVRD